MTKHSTLYITHRGERHQRASLAEAPKELDITILRTPAREEMLALLPGMEFLISERTGTIDAGLIDAGRNLRLIQRLGSQTYDIDLEAARAAGIPVCSRPVRGAIMVAEHVVMQMLSLARRLRELMHLAASGDDFGRPPRRSDEDTFAYNWTGREDLRGLWGATVGILGLGEIGFELARRLHGFGCTLLYNKRTRLPAVAEREIDVRFAGVEEMLAASDFVCALTPFSAETEQSLGDRFFAAMKPGSVFVSCGGSGIVDEEALAAALRYGHLYGAALDTYTFEPVAPDNPLLTLARDPRANVVLTPHIAAGTGAASGRERQGDYDNLIRVLRGQPLVGRL